MTTKLQKRLKKIKNAAWEEKYRPQKFSQVILPDSIKVPIQSFLDDDIVPNLILYSKSPGTGKTTTAVAIANTLGADILFIKASEDGRVQTVREDINNFGMTADLDGKPKVIVLDEADGKNGAAFQDALRGAIESNSMTCKFIITCNNHENIIDPLKSRCKSINFHYPKSDELYPAIKERLKIIADTEVGDMGTVSDDTLNQLVDTYYPDIRSMIKEMNFNFRANNGSISGDIVSQSNEEIVKIVELLKQGEKGWFQARKIFIDDVNDVSGFSHKFLDCVFENVDEKHHMAIATSVAEADRWNTQQINPDINYGCGLFPAVIKILGG